LSSSSPSSLRLVASNKVEELVSLKVIETLSFQEFNAKISSCGGKIDMDKFNPSAEQMSLFTSMATAINVKKSVELDVEKVSNRLELKLDVDQMVFCSNGLSTDIFGHVFAEKEPILSPPETSASNDLYLMVLSQASSFAESIPVLEPHSFNGLRQTFLQTSVSQLKGKIQEGTQIDDATAVIDLLNRRLSREFLVGHSNLDPVLKLIQKYNPKSIEHFDQFRTYLSEDFTILCFGKNDLAPFRIAICAPVADCRQGVKDLVSAWSTRKDNSNSHAGTSAEHVCDSMPIWGSSDGHVTTSMTIQSLQLAVSILVLGRQQKKGILPVNKINIICESYNQKSASYDASIPM